ncbi:RagB/SusD family nutrient uptake outer membrane protein [Pedobacter sp. UYP1]|uniref:RagB/SusD family nutrient uptake outer membrane protein n=1 Tax=Pedobacter sp. UYP1 TaxID=1756396 RepID=UPI003396663C
METRTFFQKITIILLLIGVCSSCKKDWLDVKPDKSLVIPTNIKDYQALLDNTFQTFNKSQGVGMGEIAAGDFNILYSSWQTLYNTAEKSSYIWENTVDFYKGEASPDWTNSYTRILNSNVVLDGIGKVKPSVQEQAAWNNVKGSALFFRAFDFFNLSQEFCKSYDQATAGKELGIPLRLEYDINIPATRSTLQQTYDQIIGDLKKAVHLLTTTPLYKTRPSKQAVYALLARTYLSMSIYKEAGLYADSALQIQPDLLNYASLNSANSFPISRFNSEVIFQSIFSYGIFSSSTLIVDSALYSSYAMNDIRRSVYFTNKASGGITYKGSYNGDKNLFGGLATDEIYFIRAEANVRQSAINKALDDLNLVLKNRTFGVYSEFTEADPTIVLTKILLERRKELVYRGIRWSDLRRLNKDNRYKVTLTRLLNGQAYTLTPDDPKYVFPIDNIEIRLSGIQQNQR